MNIGIYGAPQNYCVAVQLGFKRMTKKGLAMREGRSRGEGALNAIRGVTFMLAAQ
jgi:hypothetical protein